VAFQTRLEQESAVKGYSLFFSPSPAMRAAYPHLQHLWDMGPTAAPYDAMHLVLLNVVWHMWKLFTGLKLINKNRDEEYMMPRPLWGALVKSSAAHDGRCRRPRPGRFETLTCTTHH